MNMRKQAALLALVGAQMGVQMGAQMGVLMMAQAVAPALAQGPSQPAPTSAVPASAASAEAAQAKRFVISPHIEGLDVCDVAQADSRLTTMAQVRRVCQGLGATSAHTLGQALDALEPGGAQGAVQVGYTLTVPLLGMYRAEGDDWVIDEAKLQPMLDLIEAVDRPVVIYLSSSHFDTIGPLPAALREDPRNFMQYADGSVPQLGYFGFPISAYTLLTDDSIPVNRYRFRALHQLVARVHGLSEAARSRIVGYSLGGELHQMYPDFENGAGQFQQVRVTDYSPASVAAFREWLADKWGSVRKLSAATGIGFDSFDTIDAPRGNLKDGSTKRWREHYDAYASGYVPIAGWLHDPKGRVESLTLYLNGKPQGEVQRGYNRLDVYRAKDEVLTPNVGYRHDLDVSDLAPGKYLVQVVATVGGLNYELAHTRFAMAARKPGVLREREPTGARKLQVVQQPGNWLVRWWRNFLRTIGMERGAPAYLPVPDVESYLDLPGKDASGKDLVVHYNPLAREWDEFRNHQVLNYMQALYDQAIDAGLAQGEVYSHQLNDRVNSAWNAQLFAVDDVWAERQDWGAGMNLYGGGTNNEAVLRFIQRGKLNFASPEFHTQQWKVPGVPLQALQGLRDVGARFVSPYYLGLMPQHLRGGQVEHGVNRMELTPSNPKDGSDQLYGAIQELARQ